MRRGIRFLVLSALLLAPGGYGEGQEPAFGTAQLMPPGCQGEAAVLDVSADRMTFDQQQRSFLFEENVHIRQCGLTILCDRVRVTNDTKGESIQHIIATGNVRVQQGTRHVVAERAEYFAAEQRLVLTGNPRAWDTQERHEMMGDEIVILLPQDYVTVKGARVLFQPYQKPSAKAP